MASIVRFHDDPRFDSAIYSINDFTDVESTDIGDMDIKLFAAQGAGAFFTNPRIKIAIVTANPGIRQMIDSYVDLGIVGFSLAMFSSLDEARAGLNAR